MGTAIRRSSLVGVRCPLVLALVLVSGLTACAHNSRRAVTTDATYTDTTKAVATALSDCGYTVIAADSKTGIFTGERVLSGARSTGRKFKVTLHVRETKGGSRVNVSFQVPPGTIGSTSGEFRELKTALREALPDANVQ